MTRLAWLTDIHLNFLHPHQFDRFFQAVHGERPDALVITGDIGEARSIALYLKRLAQEFPIPIYFVLGNHDYYYGSFKEVAELVRDIRGRYSNLIWLDDVGVVELTSDTALVGHGGWADGRLGDYARSDVELLDSHLIYDFAGMNKRERLTLLNALGDAAADHFRRVLPQALHRYSHMLVATHVPPFREACWHEGRISNDDFLPHFTCQASGAVLREIMHAHPDRCLDVLCGHTHGSGTAQILDNLRVRTGGTEYGAPRVQQVFDLSQR